jgi:hypothetical protein
MKFKRRLTGLLLLLFGTLGCGSAQQLNMPHTLDATAGADAYLPDAIGRHLARAYQAGSIQVGPLTRVAGTRRYRFTATFYTGSCTCRIEGQVHGDTEAVTTQRITQDCS